MKAFQWSVASACLLFVLGTTTTSASPIGIVPMDSVWKYNADGTDLGAAWRGIGFDDSIWLSGAAQLGYGDGDETTLVVTPAERPPTVYFRKSVLVPSGVTSATISLLRDDGAVVYVNGVEVMRNNMPAGPVTYNTLALSAIGGGEENNVFVTGTVSPGVFVPGTNVIAVEIHQNSILSSDMSFAMGLIVDFGPPPPVVTVQAIVPETREVSPFTDQPIVPGVFRLSRTGTNEPLAVAFRLSGSASNGVDYRFVSGAVIPAGAESGDINIVAIDDDLAEGTETVVLTLEPGGCLQCYTIGSPAAATVSILDNEPANTVPVVNIFAPPEGASFKTPTNIWLQATAQDAEDADPLTVEFFAGTNRIGAATFHPTLCPQNCPYYALMWTNVPPGVFALTARATDNSGATATSAPVHITVVGTNLPPQETIVSVVALDSQASEPGILTVVDAGRFAIIRRGNLHAAIPVSFTLSGTAVNGIDYRFISNSVVIPAGVTQALVNVFALADNVVESTETVVLTLEPRVCPAIYPPPPECYAIGNPQATVFINDGPFSNSPPVVQLNEPLHGAVFNAPANIELRAFAQDHEDGHDITVEFFAGTNRIGTGIFVPTLCPSPNCPFFQLTWLNVPPGSYALTARATDRLGATTVSAPVQIQVNGPSPGMTTLIATGSVWRYLDDGSDQGTAWRAPEFNDETWASGLAQLGFGDGDEMTVLSRPGGISHPTYYFRRAFNVTNAGGISNLVVHLLRDDGGVVYLNGVEVFRSNLSSDNPFIAFNTLAETCVCCEDETTRYYDRAVDPSLLVEGRNVIAVEIHQCTITSGDLSFDFELVANHAAVPTRTTVNVRALDAQAAEPGNGLSDSGRFIIGRSGNLDVAVPVYFTLTGSASNGSDYHFISNRVVIPAGATQAFVTVFPIADNQPEPMETVVLTLQSPACIALANPPPECYLVASPDQATVAIFDSPPVTNRPPEVVITAPADGAVFREPALIQIEALTRDPDGYASRVVFFANDRMIGEANIAFIQPPPPGEPLVFDMIWTNPPSGQHVLRAQAFDDNGAGSVSPPVNITISGTIGPVVRVFATDSNAVETAGFVVNTGRFTFTRSGSLSNALPVYFTLSGTAAHGLDYRWVSNRVIIPPGSSNAHVTITPLDDAAVELTETVVLRVLSPPTSPDSIPYIVGSPSLATVFIRDDETNQPPGGILIAAGSVWRYRDIGANLGTAWRAPAYDDTAWASGPAQLGFGDGDEATVVDGGPVTNRFITTYFRRTFNVASPDAISNLIVRLLRDDGGVVYLNGVEIFRSNMPAGEVSYFTLASSAADESAGFYSSPVDPSLLVAGENVIAVEIHQNAFSSSDLSFDLELTGSDGPPPAERTVVTVVASDGQASEPGVTAAINPGQFTLRRTGNMDVAIPVSFTLTGTALNGIDYNFISNRIVIPAGSTQAVVTIVPRMDGLAEGIETVVLAVQPPACFEVIPPHPSCYLIGSPSQATVFISDGAGTNDPPVDPILVSTGAVWKYHDLGADLGTDWRLPGHDDSGWNSGPAQLGYGDLDEATVVGFGPDLMQKYITTYFRRAIEVADPLAFNSLRLRLLYDDGAVVYLNGSEVFRVNLPPGPVTYTTLASSVSSENAIAEATLPASALVPGRNVIAVEIHQINGLSSDISFDLALTASGETPPALPPTVELVAPADGATFGAPTNIMLAARATDPDGNHTLRWIEFFAGTTRVGIRTNFPGADPAFPFTVNWMNVQPGAYTLTAVATDSDGGKGTSSPVHITVSGPQVPSTNSEVHVVALYSGNVNGGSSPNHERGDARVFVDRPGKRVVLVLSAYEPVHWLVTVAPDTTLASVLLLGYYDQTVEGLPAGTGVVEMTYENSPSGFFYFSYDMNAGSFLGSVQRLCGITGRNLSSFHGTYTAPLTPFVVDSVQDDPRLQCDYPQPVDLSQLPNLNFSLSFNNGSDGQVLWQDYSLAGPFQSAARLLPTYRVVTNGSANFYYGADQHRVWRVDAQHGAVEELHLPPDLPELSWPMGITYDSLRQQILVVSLGGEGHLYAYAPASSPWSLVASMDNRDVDSLAYHAANDSFYAVTVTHGDYGPPRLLQFNTNGSFVSELPLPQQPFGIGFGPFRSELVSVDEYLVLLLETDNYVPQGAKPEARMYLIDPRSGEVWLTFRRVGNMENRAPTVRIAAPMEGAQLPPGSTTRLSAEASDPDGLVQSVEFFANGASLGMARRADNSPGVFHLDWTPEIGRYTLRARAMDGLGATAWSIPVTVGVGSNVPPETNFTFRLAFNHRDGGAEIFFRHYTLDGPIDGARLLPATRVVPDESGQWYYGAEQHQVWRVNGISGQTQFMEIPAPLPELSWPIGAAFDSLRNRVLVGTLGGEGHLYAYSTGSGQWSLVNDLNNHDFDSIVHHLADDSIYAFEGGYGGTSRLVKLDADGNYVSEIPVPQQAGGISGHSSASELVSVGEYLVLLIEPNYYPSEEFIPESRIYLIDPRTGQVRLTYNRARSFDSDRDGVPDDEDQCPGTPWYMPVDEHGCSAGQRDSDQDGVADAADECLNTLAGAIVNGNGCSIAQMAPCDGPWRNHSDYVEAVETAAESFQKAGLITLDQRQEIVGAARRSDCGYRNPTLTTSLQRTDEIRTNGFRLVLIGDGATTCVVECSTDLIQWTPISTNVLSGGAITIEDPDAMQAPRRFYRLRPDSVAPIQLKAR